MASKRETAPGVWQFRVYVGLGPGGARRYRQSTFRGGAQAAQRAMEDFASSVRREQKSAPSHGTLADLMERWLVHCQPDVERSTWHGYRRLTDRIIADIGDLPLSQVTTRRLDAYYRELLAEDIGGKRRSPSTVGHYHAVIRRALSEGVRWGELAANPATHARPPTARRKDLSVPSAEVAGRLVSGVAASNPDLGAFLFLLLATGMRRGEACGLRWSDLDGHVMRVHRSVVVVGGELVEKDTKTHQARLVDLDDPTVEVLRAHRQRMVDRARDLGSRLSPRAFVFSDVANCAKPWHPDAATKRWKRYTEAQGYPGVRVHDLRHAMATAWLDAGVPVHVVSQRLGHAKTSTTSDIYGHVPDGSQARAAQQMASLLPSLNPEAEPDDSEAEAE